MAVARNQVPGGTPLESNWLHESEQGYPSLERVADDVTSKKGFGKRFVSNPPRGLGG